MKYLYHCKHCHVVIDEIEGPQDIEKKLGLLDLTLEERAEVLTYDQTTQRVYVETICDFCYEAIITNLELSLVGKPLQ